MEAVAQPAWDLREWTRDEYRRAAELGLFRPDERLELIDGQIVTKMSPQGNPHVICLLVMTDWFYEVVGRSYHVRTQTPVALGPRDEPEPDVMVVKGKPRDYDALPTPEQVVLLVEIGDSTLTRDRRLKVPRYALAGVAEVWLMDVEGRRLEIYREPGPEGYGVATILSETKEASPLFAPEARIAVADLLPGRRPEGPA